MQTFKKSRASRLKVVAQKLRRQRKTTSLPIIDRPWFRTAWTAVEGLVVAFTVFGAFLAYGAFEEQTKLSAYQLLSTPSASPEVKWMAALTVVEKDGRVVGPTIDCPPSPSGDRLPCGTLDRFAILGQPSTPFEIHRCQADSMTFMAPRISNLIFQQCTMTNMRVYDPSLTNVEFALSDLTGTRFERLPPMQATAAFPARTDLVFSSSNLTDVQFDYDFDLKSVEIFHSDISGISIHIDQIDPDATFASSYFYDDHPPRIMDDMNKETRRLVTIGWICPAAARRPFDPFSHPDGCVQQEKPLDLGYPIEE